jgi:hypothetical protein
MISESSLLNEFNEEKAPLFSNNLASARTYPALERTTAGFSEENDSFVDPGELSSLCAPGLYIQPTGYFTEFDKKS